MESTNLNKMNKRYMYNLNKNYLILEIEDEADSYKTYMIKDNNINGLLKMNYIRKNNGQQFMYDISSLQAVDKLFGSSKLCYEEIRSIIRGVCIVSENIKKYFLKAENIILIPDMIYINPETYETQFVLNPYYCVSILEQLRELSRYFISKINYTDIDAVTSVYKFNEIVMRENFVISDILKALDFEKEKENYEKVEMEYVDEITNTKKIGIFNRIATAVRQRFNTYPELVCENDDDEYIQPNEIGNTVLMQVIKDKKYCLSACNSNYSDINIRDKGVVIGKLQKNVDVVINDPSVSRIHAKCEINGEKCYIEDLNTTNGTYINGKRLVPYKLEELKEGDRVILGCIEYIIKIS